MTDVPARLCAVEYLNTVPITYGLEQNRLVHRFNIEYASPAVCADRLRHGQADVALIPSIEYSHIRGYRNLRIVPDIAVTSHGQVKSVSLFFNRGLQDIRRIGVDQNSRTSVALLQIILREKYDIEAELVPMIPDVQRMLAEADGALIIGDRALDLADRMDNYLDLGDEWDDLTNGLPFVYSMWAGLDGALTDRDVETLIRSRDLGLSTVDTIARDFAAAHPSSGHSADYFAAYLTDHIQFHLGKSELEGLKEYYTYCYYYGLIDEIPEFLFYPTMESAVK